MGNQNYIDINAIKKEYLKAKQTKYLYCTNCFLVPLIKPFLVKEKLYISIYCKCSNDEKQYMPFETYIELIMKYKKQKNFCKKHKSTKSFLFCLICEQWLCNLCIISHKQINPLHIYSQIPIRLIEYCRIHQKQKSIGYCNTCGTNICNKCYEAKLKLRHDAFKYDINYINQFNKIWNSNNFAEIHLNFFSKNEKIKNEMINLINNSKDISDEEKNMWNNKINNAYMKNKNINQQLSEYILILFSNYDYSLNICKIVNHNIFRNLDNIKYDNSIFSIKEKYSPIKNADKLIEYFNNVHIIHLNSFINIKNITSEKKNVTNEISKLCLLDRNSVATLTSDGIIIIWNYLTYDELYRIKKLTVNPKNYFKKNNVNNINNINNDQNNINDSFEEEDNIEKKINILKVFVKNKNVPTKQNPKSESNKGNKKNDINKNINNNNSNNNNSNNNNNNNNIINEEKVEEGEKDLEPNFNFISMAYIKEYKLLTLIIENYKEIYIFDILKKESLNNISISHKKEVLAILALKNNDLASYGNDFALRIWNMKYFQNVLTIYVEIKKYYIYFTQLLYGNIIFATGESVIKILKLPEYEFNNDITCIKKPINYFEIPDKKLIISSEDFHVRILKPPDYKDVVNLFNMRTKIYSFLLLDKKRLLLSLEDKDKSLNIMDLNKKKKKNNLKSICKFWSPVGSLIKTKDNRLISISWDNYIKIILVGG